MEQKNRKENGITAIKLIILIVVIVIVVTALSLIILSAFIRKEMNDGVRTDLSQNAQNRYEQEVEKTNKDLEEDIKKLEELKKIYK